MAGGGGDCLGCMMLFAVDVQTAACRRRVWIARSRLPGTDSMQVMGSCSGGPYLDGDWGLGSRRGAMRRLGVLEHDTGLVN